MSRREESIDHALELLDRNPGSATDLVLAKLLEFYPERDQPRGVDRALQIGDPSLRDQTLIGNLRNWQKRSPADAQRWIQDHPLSGAVTQALATPQPCPFSTQDLPTDMDARNATIFTVGMLLTIAAVFAGGRYRHDLLAAEKERWLQDSQRNAGSPTEGSDSFRISGRGESNPEPRSPETLARQLHAALQTRQKNDRTRALMALSSHFTAQEWLLALEVLKDERWLDARMVILDARAEVDASAAAACTMSFWPDARYSLMSDWARTDPPSAMAWIGERLSNGRSARSLASMMLGSLKDDLPALTRAIQDLPPHEKPYVLAEIRLNFSDTPTAVLRDWLKELNPQSQSEMLSFALSKLPDPHSRIDLAHEFPGVLTQEEMSPVFSAWMETAPEEALASIEAIPSSTERDRMAADMAHYLAETSKIPEAFQLLERYPQAAQSQTLNLMSCYASAQQAVRLLPYLQLVSDADSRIVSTRNALLTWQKQDPAAVKEWVGTHPVPEILEQEFGP